MTSSNKMAAPMKHVGEGDSKQSMMCSTSCDHTSVPKMFSENLGTTLNQMKSETGWKSEIDGFDNQKYWQNQANVMNILNKEVTKLSLSYSSPPRPKCSEAEALFSESTKCILALVSCAYRLPLNQGKQLCLIWRRFYVTLFSTLYEYSTALWGTGGEQSIHIQTGVIWEMCKRSEALPKANHHCLIQTLQQVSELVDDAHTELHQAVTSYSEEEEEEMDSSESISQADKLVLIAGQGLVKAAKILIKKCLKSSQITAHSDTVSQILDSDILSDVFSQTSELVDDFSLSLYPPSNRADIKDNLTPLVDHLNLIITKLRETHICTESEIQWTNVIDNAITHNYEKVSSLVT